MELEIMKYKGLAILLAISASVLIVLVLFFRNPESGMHPQKEATSGRSTPDALGSKTARQANNTGSKPKRPPSTSLSPAATLSTVEELKAEWLNIDRGNDPQDKKGNQKIRLIEQACRAGLHADVLDQIYATTGAGSDRNRYVMAVFGADGIPVSETFGLFSLLQNKEEIRKAEEGIAARIGKMTNLNDLDQCLQNPTQSTFNAVAGGLPRYVQNSRKGGITSTVSFDEAREVIAKMPPDQQKATLSAIISDSMTGSEPFSTWSYLNREGLLANGSITQDAVDRVVMEMMRNNPASAMEQISKEDHPHAFTYALTYWAKKDETALEQWITKNKDHLGSDKLSAYGQMRSGQPPSNSGIRPTNKLTLPAKITPTTPSLTEEKPAQTSSPGNPGNEGTRQSLTALDNAISAGGLRDGKELNAIAKTLVKTDPLGLSEWYSSNISHLNPNENDRIVEAFATEAIQLNQNDTAKNWIELMKDQVAKNKMLEALKERSK